MSLPVSFADIARKMKSICPPSFKASTGWIKGFKKRFNLTLRIPTLKIPLKKWDSHRVNSIPVDVMEKIKLYDAFYTKLMTTNKYDDDDIFNMDETPIWFNSTIRSTVDVKGKKEIALKTDLAEDKKRITAVLTVTRSGKLLPPVVIEKSQSKAAKESAGDTRYERIGLQCYKQKSNTMNEHIMLSWIKKLSCFLKPKSPNIVDNGLF